jgi:UDP-N-acetylglucosamine--N-acetylmuramyl-(pentapeptide) pyrophosphoryl-undecaprenol N-acetylglucosamine transferase
MRPNNVLIAAGGTGGHVFPAIATAQELKNRGCKVLFATDSRGEKYLKNSGFEYKVVSSASPNPKKPMSMLKLLIGTFQSIALIIKFRPKAVLGFGGYPSFPPLFAARLLFKRTVLHEQNSVLGKANRLLAKLSGKVAVSFPNMKGEYVGNPVRSEITSLPMPPLDGKIHLLVTGGSQGAKLFADVIPDVIAEFKDQISITHQVTEKELPIVRAKYQAIGVEHEVKTFFDDMPKRLADCHLLIARSGASTIFELAVAGRPAIFVPLAIAADDHQRINAQNILASGGGWMIAEKDFNKESLKNLLGQLIVNPEKIILASAKIKEFSKPDAAAKLADLVLN